MECLAWADECYGRPDKKAKNEILGCWSFVNREKQFSVYVFGNIDAASTPAQNIQYSYGSEVGMVNADPRKLGLSLPLLTLVCFFFNGCDLYHRYDVVHEPNYDSLIGTRFSKSVFKGREVSKKIREIGDVEELYDPSYDGCVLVFGVGKFDDLIKYWRIDSGPGTCLVRRNALAR